MPALSASIEKKTMMTKSASATCTKSDSILQQQMDINSDPSNDNTIAQSSQVANEQICTSDLNEGSHFYQYSVTTPSKSLVLSKYGTPRRTALDHSYSTSRKQKYNKELCGGPAETAVKSQSAGISVGPQESAPVSSSSRSSSPAALNTLDESEDESDISDIQPLSDISYVPSDGEVQSDIEYLQSVDINYQGNDRVISADKYIVYRENLEQLMKFCMECGAPVTGKIPSVNGSMISYKISCHEGHSYTWDAQQCVGKKPLGNVALSAAILATGNTYARIAEFATAIGLLFLSQTTYNRYQRNTLIPVIQEEWEKERRIAVAELLDVEDLVVAGDARCDSPGHVSKFGSYTLMHASGGGSAGTRKIVAIEMVQVSEVKNSNHMEPEGLKRCLDIMKEELDIATLATDRHLMVGAMMRKEYPEIDHQFDIWHFSKSILKKITAKSKLKGCEILGNWTQSIANHFWWCAASCNGDAQLLKEMWISLLNHITNTHEWGGNVTFHKCDHLQLTSQQKAKTKWLKSKSDAFKALQAIVLDKRLIKALPHITKFCHTGDLEVFHSMLLKYCSKRQHFQYDAMKARLMLAALDWNSQSREIVTDGDGENVEKLVYSKRRKQWVLKCRYIKKKMQHVPRVIERALEVEMEGLSVPAMKRPKDLPAYVASVVKPEKSAIIKTSRFNVKK
jgi:hypothetical protein